MSESSSISREGLLKALNLVKPALSNQNYVPILTHFCFDGSLALAYNDVHAIGVRYSLDGIECSVPGDLMLKMAASLPGSKVSVDFDDENLKFISGRSRVKIPTMPATAFTFDFPTGKRMGHFKVDQDLLKGLEKCSISVGSDPTNPAQMGITLARGNDYSALFSTDGYTMSRYILEIDPDLPGDSPIILPTFFCDQLVTLGRAFPDEEVEVDIFSGAVVAKFGDQAKLFSKLVLDVEPLDFETVMSRNVDLGKVKKKAVSIPDSLDQAFDRAMIVSSAEVERKTKLSIDGGKIEMLTLTQLGESKDTLNCDGDFGEFDIGVDPSFVARASKSSYKMALFKDVVVFCDDTFKFSHLIATLNQS